MGNSAMLVGFGSGAGQFLAEDHTIQNVYNTTSEVTVLSKLIPAGLITAGDALKIDLLYDCAQNAVGVQYQHRLKFGSTVMMAFTFSPVVQQNYRTAAWETFFIRFQTLSYILNYGHILMSSPGSTIGVEPASLPVGIPSYSQSQALSYASSGQNFANDTTISVTVQPNQLRGDSDHQVWGWTMEHMTS